MKTGTHNLLFRSASMKNPSSLQAAKYNQNNKGCASKKPTSVSLDNLLVEMSRDAFQEWFPTSCDFARTEGIQCLVIPDKVLLTEVIQKQRSVSLNYGGCSCNHENENKSSSQLKRSSSVKEKDRQKKCMPRSQTLNRIDGTSTSGFEPRRSISLYDRKHVPHSCAHIDPRPKSPLKPSPWTYGSTSPQNNKNTGNDVTFKRTRSNTTSSLSLDSSGSFTKRSMSSVSSISELEKETSTGQQYIKRPSSAVSFSRTPDSIHQDRKISFIPRPVTSKQNPRDRSHTISEVSTEKIKSRTSPIDTSPSQNRHQPKKSNSFRMPGGVKSAPTSALPTPTDPKSKIVWSSDLNQQSSDLIGSTESMDTYQHKDRVRI